MAEQIESSGDTTVIGCAIVVLDAEGSWAGMMSPGITPFVGSALLDHAKTDLVLGGQRWMEFEPNKTDHVN
jgi:hypothetical protein